MQTTIFKFNENGSEFYKRIGNTAGKGEIARYEQFLLFPQCFHKIYTADTLKPGLVWERVNENLNEFKDFDEKRFRKEKPMVNLHFLLNYTVVSPHFKDKSDHVS